MEKGVSMYNIAEDILFGEILSIPYHPVIKNPALAVNVTITIRDDFDNVINTYTTTIEQGCRNCEFGACEISTKPSCETNTEPCVTCFKKHTPEHPYQMWVFDTKYDPRDDFLNY